MNESNIDRLLKLTAPLTERNAPTAPRELTTLPAFSDQLWQLTAPIANRGYNDSSIALYNPPPAPPETKPIETRLPERDRPPIAAPSNDNLSHSRADSRNEPAPPNGKDSHRIPTAESGANSAEHVSHIQSGDEADEHDKSHRRDSADQAGAAAGLSAASAAASKSAPAGHRGGASGNPVAAESAEADASDAALSTSNGTKQGEAVDTQTASIAVDQDATIRTPSASKATPKTLRTAAGHGDEPNEASAPHNAAATAAADELAPTTGEAMSNQGAAAKSGDVARHGAEGDEAGAPAASNQRAAQHNPKAATNGTSPAAEVQSVAPEIATQEESKQRKSSDATDTDGQSGRAADGPAHARGKEANTHAPQEAAQPSAAAIQAIGPTAADATSTDDTSTAVKAVDGKSSPATPSAAARAEAWTTTFARGPRGGAPGQAAKESPELSPADATRFVGRVTRAFHTAQERGGSLQLRLSPPELGSLHLELTVKDGVLNARLEAETSAARQLLLDHLPALRDRLAEQNIRVERFDVNVRQDAKEGRSDVPQQQQQPQQRQPQNSPSPRRTVNQPTSAGERAPRVDLPSPTANAKSGINLIV